MWKLIDHDMLHDYYFFTQLKGEAKRYNFADHLKIFNTLQF